MQTIYLKSPMKEEFKKYIKKEENNTDINKTEIWIGNFSSDPTPTIDPIDIICKIIPHFQNQDNKIIIDDYLRYNNEKKWEKPLIFNNIIFNKSVDFNHNSFEDYISFTECTFKYVSFGSYTFKKEVTFESCTFKKEVTFENCTFLEKVTFKNCTFKKEVTFENCTFKKEVTFGNCTFEKEVTFGNCTFRNEIILENDKCLSFFASIHFYKTIFNGNTSFSRSKFYHAKFEDIDLQGDDNQVFAECLLENVDFLNVNFRGNIQFDQSEMKDVSFKNCTFKGNSDFRKVSFKGKSEFLNCTFEPLTNAPNEQVLFSDSTFEGKTDFTGSSFNVKTNFSYPDSYFRQKPKGCYFKDNVDFKGCNFSEVIFEEDTNFSESIFGKEGDTSSYEVYFNDAKFKKNIRFHFCQFYNEVSFYNTSFEKLTDFYLVKFYKAQQFHLTDFLDRAIFSNTIFYREAQFLYNKVENNSYINFESAIFKRGLDISRSNFNCNLNFWNTTIEEDGEDYIFKNIDDIKYKNDFEAHNEVPSIYKQLRETYRIIKDNSYKQNNKIEALEFSKREILVYERELKSVSSKNNNDKLLLLANKISNNFGTNWLRGILFTASAGIITYLLMLCCLPFIHNTYIFISFTSIIIIISAFSFLNKDIDSFLPILILIILSFLLTIILFKSPFVYKENICIKDYIIPDFIKILNVIDLKPFEKEENSIFNLSGLSYLFLFIGRIFIGYGYYQTIQAFRKFGKS